MRTVGFPRRFACSALSSDLPPPPGPVPILATQAARLQPIIVTFDQPLVPGFSDRFNWHGVTKNGVQPRHFARLIGKATIAGATVSCTPNIVLPGADPPRVSYTAAIPDVVSLATGVPAAPFVNYPVV